jgi:hypothetical protein
MQYRRASHAGTRRLLVSTRNDGPFGPGGLIGQRAVLAERAFEGSAAYSLYLTKYSVNRGVTPVATRHAQRRLEAATRLSGVFNSAQACWLSQQGARNCRRPPLVLFSPSSGRSPSWRCIAPFRQVRSAAKCGVTGLTKTRSASASPFCPTLASSRLPARRSCIGGAGRRSHRLSGRYLLRHIRPVFLRSGRAAATLIGPFVIDPRQAQSSEHNLCNLYRRWAEFREAKDWEQLMTWRQPARAAE